MRLVERIGLAACRFAWVLPPTADNCAVGSSHACNVDAGGKRGLDVMDDPREAQRSAIAESLWVKVRPEWIEKELARRSCLDMLMSRFGIDAALVSVPQLAKVLGMSKSTIYAGVKAGTFFIRHRLIGASPVFTIDDVVTWYMDGEAEVDSRPRAARDDSRGADKTDPINRPDDGGDSLYSKDRRGRDRAVDAMVARVLKSMGHDKGAEG